MLVASVDYPNKKIYLGIASVGVDLDTLDIYKEVRALRVENEEHRKFKPMIVAGGNLQKTETTATARYVQLLYGCSIVPYDATQTLTIIRDTFSDDGRAGAQCFDTTGFTHVVNFDYDFDKIEVVRVATSGNEYTLDQIANASADAVMSRDVLTEQAFKGLR